MSVDIGQILTEDLSISVNINAKDQTVRVASDVPCTFLVLLTALESAHLAVMKEMEEKLLDKSSSPVIH